VIIQCRDEDLLHLYRCGRCSKVFSGQVGRSRISCLVPHPPGSCCHYGERELNEQELARIAEALLPSGLATEMMSS
jgi:hypothetical protein